MSAWLVTKEHIDVLVTAGITTGLITPGQAVATGDMLWRDNAANIRHLYEERADECDSVEADGYTEYRPLGIEDPFWTLKQAQCFDYQCCDRSEWAEGPAYAFMNELERRLLGLVGMTLDEARQDPRWSQANWGVDVRDDGSLIVTSDDFSRWCAEWRAKHQEQAG